MADQKTTFTRTKRNPKVELRGQAAVILGYLNANPTTPFTIEGLTAAVTSQIVTRQDPERVVAYYLSIFKKRGFVLAERPVQVIEDEATEQNAAPKDTDEVADEPEENDDDADDVEDEDDTDDVEDEEEVEA